MSLRKDIKYNVFCKTYENGQVVSIEKTNVLPGRNVRLEFGEGSCLAEVIWGNCQPDIEGKLCVSFLRDGCLPVSVGLEAVLGGWKREDYLFAPGAVYNGNRFVSKALPYPPYNRISEDEAISAPSVITDIPHLDVQEEQSQISFLSGDMSTPAMGVFSREEEEGWLLFGRHVSGDGTEYTGFAAREDLTAGEMKISYCFPGVREGRKYFFGERADGSGFYPDSHTPSEEEGRCFSAGEHWELPFLIAAFPAAGLDEFFRKFNVSRSCLEAGDTTAPAVPFSHAYQAIKGKYQRENFIIEKNGGYFAVGTRRDVPPQCWQAGWIGGGMNNLPFLLEDEEEAFTRGLLTFQFILDCLQQDNGWVTGMYAGGRVYGDAFEEDPSGAILLVRKNADLLYFLLKEQLLLRDRSLLRQGDEKRIRNLCDAFVRLYKKYGQLGQFIDIHREKILIGNSAGASMAAGALALACEVFGEEEYLTAARSLGDYYASEYLEKGVLNGGPGEICQAPDSEAAFALLEAYVQLYETTGEDKWLKLARDACELAVTWVMSYDFTFPKNSTASKRQVHSIGTVFANAQNKHSAPGICTLSGNSLLKLYRFTGEEKYLHWLQTISHSLTQFVSLKDRPVATLEGPFLPEGYMNERVQTSDWEGSETVGEFLYGSNWPEVTMLLTYVEVPGIYVDISGRLVKVFDHILCREAVWEPQRVILKLENPTEYPALVTVLVDEFRDRRQFSHNYYGEMEKISLAPGEQKVMTLQIAETNDHTHWE